MKALFQKSKDSLSHNLKQNSMKNLFKTPKGMMRIIKKNAMAVAAIGIAMGSYGLMSFGASSKSEVKSSANQEYGMLVENRGQSNETRTWVSLDGLTEGLDFVCEGITHICKGEFTPAQIDPLTNLPYDNEEPSNPTEGNFKLTP